MTAVPFVAVQNSSRLAMVLIVTCTLGLVDGPLLRIGSGAVLAGPILPLICTEPPPVVNFPDAVARRAPGASGLSCGLGHFLHGTH